MLLLVSGAVRPFGYTYEPLPSRVTLRFKSCRTGFAAPAALVHIQFIVVRETYMSTKCEDV
jgi:hypothetical protein